MRARALKNSLPALTWACAYLCFALQQVLIPGHLAAHDHTVHDLDSLHSHGTGEHHHPHHSDPIPERDVDRDHTPHSAQDHLSQLDPALPGSTVAADLTTPPPLVSEPFGDLPFLGLQRSEECIPHPPPPRGASAPRSPPSDV